MASVCLSTMIKTSIATLSLLLAAATTACTFTPDPVPAPSPTDPANPSGAADPCVKDKDIVANEEWSPAACPSGYTLTNEVAVRGAAVTLTIDAGTLVKATSQASLTIAPDASLVAHGTADAKIRFTGATGPWKGIEIDSTSMKNALSFVTIEKAAASGALSFGSFESAGRAELADLELVNNEHYGLKLTAGSKLGTFDRVRVGGNADGPVWVQAPLVDQLKGADNRLEGIVLVETDILLPIDHDATWPNLAPATYRVVGQNGQAGDLLYVGHHLTIEAGTTIEMAGGSGFLVEGGTGGLAAIGTPAAPITIKGIDGSAWLGITFGETTWTGNRLENVKIANASEAPSWSYYGTGASDKVMASVLLGYNFTTNVQLTLKDVTFSGPNAAPADIAKKSAAVLTQEGANVGAAGALNVEQL